MNDVVDCVRAYEHWVDAQVETVSEARADKHRRMGANPFAFFRATYFRWLVNVTRMGGSLPGPWVDAVGDLHVENFGTWRDVEARLVWGVNDLDEADRLPAVLDLLRLLVSVRLAQEHAGLALGVKDVVAVVLSGYGAALDDAGTPTVLDRPDPPAPSRLRTDVVAQQWWSHILSGAPVEHPGTGAEALLRAALPAEAGPVRFVRRVAGMGSRDRTRIVAVADFAGAPVLREAKALPPPATRWLQGEGGSTPSWWRPDAGPGAGQPPEATARRLLSATHTSRDPLHTVHDGWVVRRLAPWCDRFELTDLHSRVDAEDLLRCMGAEVAVLHLTSVAGPGVGLEELRSLAGRATRHWLADASRQLQDATKADWQTWRAHLGRESA